MPCLACLSALLRQDARRPKGWARDESCESEMFALRFVVYLQSKGCLLLLLLRRLSHAAASCALCARVPAVVPLPGLAFFIRPGPVTASAVFAVFAFRSIPFDFSRVESSRLSIAMAQAQVQAHVQAQAVSGSAAAVRLATGAARSASSDAVAGVAALSSLQNGSGSLRQWH